jgi:hypothetical protein
MMNRENYLPDSNRIGVLASTVLLALVLTRLLQVPGLSFELQLPGFFIRLPLNLATIMSLLTAGLTATGMDWLLRSHPALKGKTTIQWWLLPTLTTVVISVLLSLLPDGIAWWIGFALSSLFLILVFLAEYIAVDQNAPYYPIAIAGLIAISYTLFFILAVALRYGNMRLFLILPTLFLASGLASLRIQNLRLGGRWEYAWSLGIAFVCSQIAAGLHYWPLSPIQFGLMLIGPLYGVINFAIQLGEDLPARGAALLPAIATSLCWGIAIVIR